MKMSYVRLVVGISLLTVIALASCDLFGSDEPVSRSERRDTFLSQLKAGQYDRLNGNMHPDVREAAMNTANYWTEELGAGGGWEFQVISTTQVEITAGPVASVGQTFNFTYGLRGDDYYFTKISRNGDDIAPR